MAKYILKRFLQAIPTFLIITAVVFFLSNMAPGSPLDMIKAGGELTEEAEAALRTQYGLDRPLVIRYVTWLAQVFQGNFGISTRTQQPVWNLISERIVPTLILSLSSLGVSLLIAIPVGVMAAVKPYSVWDNISSFLSFMGAAAPNFFIALILVYIFSVKLGVLPAMGMYSGNKGNDMVDLLKHLILPCFVMVIQILGNFIKQTRGSMLDVLNEEYVKTARSKGLKEGVVTVKHILRNAWIPIVASIGMTVPLLVGGATVTEQVFGWPGMGSLLILSISQRDYNTIMGITILIAGAVLIANLLIDLIYAYLDPRIRLD
ncbi:ABC transporter permease [Lacrimispora sp.]|uniref:ABC transporter permease n=1 Tax=Lacrimispora sp. TaxID=2719234 RepID=UPI00399169CD